MTNPRLLRPSELRASRHWQVITRPCEKVASQASFTALELAATLPREPLYAACGFQVIERIEATLPDEISLPLTRIGKGIV